MIITIKNGTKHYRANISPAWAAKRDNGALISCGLTVGKDLPERDFRLLETLTSRGQAILQEISHEEYNHSGCQSYCTRRGDDHCGW